MTITQKTIKLLWANAAGRCSFNGCTERLTVALAEDVSPYTLGEMAHIKGDKPGTNRYDRSQTEEDRDNYKNLILLCSNHHTLIDKPENEETFTVEILTNMRKIHELNVLTRLRTDELLSIDQVKERVSIFLAENRQAWLQYGPLSDIAKRNPNSEELHAFWMSEKLSTIVPNNRIIVDLLSAYRDLFGKHDQRVVSQFLAHATSYEKWVNDEIPYQAVTPFPVNFEQLITGT